MLIKISWFVIMEVGYNGYAGLISRFLFIGEFKGIVLFWLIISNRSGILEITIGVEFSEMKWDFGN